jgi:release factor glutamine methyltransferase
MQDQHKCSEPENVGQAVRRTLRVLQDAGIGEANIEAKRLCEAVTGHTPSTLFLHADDKLTAEQMTHLDGLVMARVSGKPVGRILGEREFYGLPLRLVTETLEPRPDTEVLVDAAFAELRVRENRERVILDLGCGTGAIGLAILSQRSDVRCVAVDVAPEAAACARANAEALGLGARFAAVAASWGDTLIGSFDAIVSNPPYISVEELDALPQEVRAHDPLLALDGGADGLDAYRAILSDIERLLAPGGFAALETGATQHDQISRIAEAEGFVVTRSVADLAGNDRVVILQRKS